MSLVANVRTVAASDEDLLTEVCATCGGSGSAEHRADQAGILPDQGRQAVRPDRRVEADGKLPGLSRRGLGCVLALWRDKHDHNLIGAVLVTRTIARIPQPQTGQSTMGKCDTCGNDYDKAFQVTMGNRTMTFDSFECAIQAMAPQCSACGCRIIGHGLETNDQFFCCDHCAEEKGIEGLKDRV